MGVPTGAVTFTATRAGGPGGQNVNNTSSRCEMRLPLAAIAGLGDRARQRLADALGSRLTADGEIIIACDETRSLRANKDLAVERLAGLVVAALPEPRLRKRTRPSWGSVQRRLGEKMRRGAIKRERRDRDVDSSR